MGRLGGRIDASGCGVGWVLWRRWKCGDDKDDGVDCDGSEERLGWPRFEVAPEVVVMVKWWW